MMQAAPQRKKPNLIARALDGFIGTLSPRRGLQRQMARSLGEEWMLGAGGYRAARKNRLNSNWQPMDGSADEAILQDLPTLRARSQDVVRNNADAAGIVTTMVCNVVATGIRLQARPMWSEVMQQADGLTEELVSATAPVQEALFNRWSPWADAAGRLDFFEMQEQVERSMLVDGEVLAVRQMLEEERRPFKTAVELIEPSRLATPTDKISDASIRGGVQIGQHGEPVGYWIQKPGQITTNSDAFTFIPRIDEATGLVNVLHLFHQERPGQTRGVPMLSAQLDLCEHIERYVEAEVVAARSAACNGLIVKTPDPFSAAAANASITQTGADGTERIENLQPNMVHYLLPGQDISTFQVDRPGTQFEGFLTVMQRRFGTAWGLPYELIAKDFSKTNYSSARAALLQAYRLFRYRQAWLSRKFCQPVYEWVMHEAAAKGELPIDVVSFVMFADLLTVAHWVPPGWEWVDPMKEASAAEKSMGNYLSSLQLEASARGQDWEQVLEDEARVLAKMNELGLPIPKVFQGGTGTQPEDDLLDDDEEQNEG